MTIIGIELYILEKAYKYNADDNCLFLLMATLTISYLLRHVMSTTA